MSDHHAASPVVLVPGGWHGAWAYEQVIPRLIHEGLSVHAVTLAGLEHEPSEEGVGANLDTHVDQVVRVVSHAPAPVVLAGHSYGGMIVAGVADRVPDRVAHLVHLDAYVPADGDSCWSLTSDRFRDAFVTGAAGDGRTIAVPPGLDARARPHPVATMLQSVRLRRPDDPQVPRTFVYGGTWSGSPFVELVDDLRGLAEWSVVDMPVGHDLMNRDPDGVATLLSRLARTGRRSSYRSRT